MTPSIAISRLLPSQGPIVARVASGAAAYSNSRRSGASPSRWRAWHNADRAGIRHACSQAATKLSPPIIFCITSSYGSPKSNASAVT